MFNHFLCFISALKGLRWELVVTSNENSLTSYHNKPYIASHLFVKVNQNAGSSRIAILGLFHNKNVHQEEEWRNSLKEKCKASEGTFSHHSELHQSRWHV